MNGPIPRIVWQDEAGRRQVMEDVTGLIVRIELDGKWERVGNSLGLHRTEPLKKSVAFLELAIALEACKALHEKLIQAETELRAEKTLSELLEVRLKQARGEH